jgi:hypothetical protein
LVQKREFCPAASVRPKKSITARPKQPITALQAVSDAEIQAVIMDIQAPEYWDPCLETRVKDSDARLLVGSHWRVHCTARPAAAGTPNREVNKKSAAARGKQKVGSRWRVHQTARVGTLYRPPGGGGYTCILRIPVVRSDGPSGRISQLQPITK